MLLLIVAWSSRFDEENKVYYYNRLTNEKTYTKPLDFDGYDPLANQTNEYTNTFVDFKATPFCKKKNNK